VNFRLHCKANKDLPKLAWLACLNRDKGIVTVIHGLSVEFKDNWIVEGVWSDDFEQGNFHLNENFFGSGIRISGDSVYFVPSSALVDRLLFCEDQGKIFVSNSLILLLALTGACLDDNHDYHSESLSILEGIDNYNKEFNVIHHRIKCFYQVFYENIIFSNGRISFQKRSKLRKINSFEQYYGLLNEILLRIKNNYRSKARKNPVSAFTTLSAGYDSTAVSCLAKKLGVKTCFTGNVLDMPWPLSFIKRRRENTEPIAKSLELDIQYLDSRRSSISETELYFLTTNYPKFSSILWSELSFHSMTADIEKNCCSAVVFTGYHGGGIWDVNAKRRYLNDQIKRKDMSGLNLTEIRLKGGFINVPVAFILARNIKDIVKISRSREMESWRLNNAYDRPIPRRILETSGVNRQLFGMRKKYIAMGYFWPVNARLRKQFFKYIKEKYNISFSFVYIYYIINLVVSKFTHRTFFVNNLDFYFLMRQWAIRVMSKRTSQIFAKDETYKLFRI
jgi:hypothetical protein